jgi:hypothetical protein
MLSTRSDGREDQHDHPDREYHRADDAEDAAGIGQTLTTQRSAAGSNPIERAVADEESDRSEDRQAAGQAQQAQHQGQGGRAVGGRRGGGIPRSPAVALRRRVGRRRAGRCVGRWRVSGWRVGRRRPGGRGRRGTSWGWSAGRGPGGWGRRAPGGRGAGGRSRWWRRRKGLIPLRRPRAGRRLFPRRRPGGRSRGWSRRRAGRRSAAGALLFRRWRRRGRR